MFRYILLLFLSIIAFSFCAEKDVVEMTDENFTNLINLHKNTLVMFFAPWCGHCKKLKPEFAKAAEELKIYDPPITLAKVDCTEEGKETCQKFSVSGYPTLKIFKDGDLSKDYTGPRDASGIAKYMKSQVGPASKELHTKDDFKKFTSATDASIVGFFEKESDLKSVFVKFADKKRENYRFAHTSSSEILKDQKKKDSIVLFRPPHLHNKFESDSVEFNGNSLDELKIFISDNYHGMVGHRTIASSKDFKNPLVVVYYDVDYVKNLKGTNYWRNRVLKVASQLKDKEIYFAISAKDEFQHEINEYGYDYTGDKPIVLARDDKNKKYVMKDEFSVDNLEKFVKKLIAGELDPYIKSEPIPENNDEAVKVAVAKNFDDIVTNNGMDTLIEFYAPWCGHCKNLEPIYKELAEKLIDEDIAIVKMDATTNDVPSEYEVSGFPTLYWLPKNRSKPVRYDAGRELKDLIKYIANHATNELKGWDRTGTEKKTEL